MRQKEIIGAFLRVPIDEKDHTYGRIISKLVYAFYDFKTDLEITNLELIEKSNVLFKLIIHRDAVTKGYWKIIGIKELPEDLKVPVPFFKQEIGNPDECSIVAEDESRKATQQQCVGLERLAVWEHDHIEQRLRDYYNGVRNNDTIALRLNGIL
ncbi:immunity 26/phosphotriesterase HocA family protein [Mucilaginibacter sp.]|uniref:immunity 26/phosphotriesterase HocA family protein n=1 Tax=Mucilaginibacter sp. TaxID=1882438 RepID=UPI00284C30AD|nr:immunity 26/phosphotriesterase HocA family protein [Mucilaginibacter sp.]MDR3693813.1 immunity 26/phosphotriesterase HocA family protein [Mucilaginibacter sp.]